MNARPYNNTPAYKAYKKAYHAEHREEAKAYHRVWRAAHREEQNAKRRAYHRANREQELASNKAWRKKNPDANRKWRESNRERSLELKRLSRARHAEKAAASVSAWKRKHSEEVRNHNRARRAVKLRAAGPGLTASQWKRLVRLFRARCAYCRVKAKLTLEHFVALVRGGQHDASNIVPACGSCNSSKRHSDPFMWMHRRGVSVRSVVRIVAHLWSAK